jgi:hypothetical protein
MQRPRRCQGPSGRGLLPRAREVWRPPPRNVVGAIAYCADSKPGEARSANHTSPNSPAISESPISNWAHLARGAIKRLRPTFAVDCNLFGIRRYWHVIAGGHLPQHCFERDRSTPSAFISALTIESDSSSESVSSWKACSAIQSVLTNRPRIVSSHPYACSRVTRRYIGAANACKGYKNK